TVKGGGARCAATTGPHADGIGHVLDRVAQTDLLIPDEPRKAHAIGFIFLSDLSAGLFILHGSTPRMSRQQVLVCGPRIEQRWRHGASSLRTRVQESKAQLSPGRCRKLRPD